MPTPLTPDSHKDGVQSVNAVDAVVTGAEAGAALNSPTQAARHRLRTLLVYLTMVSGVMGATTYSHASRAADGYPVCDPGCQCGGNDDGIPPCPDLPPLPATPTRCSEDADNDGYWDSCGDCDDSDPEIGDELLWFPDRDDDGFGDLTTEGQNTCEYPPEYPGDSDFGFIPERENGVDAQNDCDDFNKLVSPDAEEIPGDGVDQNCDKLDY